MSQVKAIPDAYKGATPYLCVNDAAGAIEFYKKAFGATELQRMEAPGGKIAHAELKIGEGIIMLADEFPEMGFVSPQTLGGSPITLYLYFEDVDAVAESAVAGGAKLLKPVEDQFYGDRSGRLEDPYGHIWGIATHKEDLSEEEVKRRAAAMFG
ncbi:MAG: VOC family protein [Acidobacteria bacterium]|nr:VOC family protein [Acidobacteriota bacterium]